MVPTSVQAGGETEGSRPKNPAAIVERRRRNRLDDQFPVTLVAARKFFGSSLVGGVTKDYDEAGACITCSRALPIGTAVRVRLHLSRSISDFFRGLPCEFRGRVAAVREQGTGGPSPYEIILRWDRSLPDMLAKVISSYQRKIGVLIAAAMAAVIWAKWQDLDLFWYSPFFYIYGLTLMTYLVSRFLISWKHKTPPLSGFTPKVSIIIPVRNEENSIARTIETCYRTDYPKMKREILVIDDGSTDGTARVLKSLGEKFPDLKVWTIAASGKRRALAEGVLKASGEIVIFVDSDTFLFPDALRHIVCGFEDPALGASAGYTEVENADTNALTGLQEVRYFVSYRLLKASEGLFGCVTCCPGCLSAYRREYVLDVLQLWLDQKFLGAPATIGDDRSLTNFILRKYRVIYNDRAVASTLVPETWGRYMRQQLRWKKSWLRETLIASGFMYKKHPVAALSFYAAALISLLSPAMAARIVFLAYRGDGSIFLLYMPGLILIGLLQSLYFLYRRPSPHWLLGMLWMASALLITGPQTYYALLTVRKNHWGTR
jgi:hyaluronan synthase